MTKIKSKLAARIPTAETRAMLESLLEAPRFVPRQAAEYEDMADLYSEYAYEGDREEDDDDDEEDFEWEEE